MKIKVFLYNLGDHADTVGTVIRHHRGGFVCEVDKVIEINKVPFDEVKVYTLDGSTLYDIVHKEKHSSRVTLYVKHDDSEIEVITGLCRLQEVTYDEVGSNLRAVDRRKNSNSYLR